jgi:hypothetical protein
MRDKPIINTFSVLNAYEGNICVNEFEILFENRLEGLSRRKCDKNAMEQHKNKIQL